jgi:sortase A
VIWSRAAGLAGRSLVTLGLLVFAFLAYQLWGTGLYEANRQAALRNQFRAELHGDHATRLGTAKKSSSTATTGSTPTGVDPSSSVAGETGVNGSAVLPPGPPPPEGSAVGIIQIPSIGVDKAIVQGVGVPDLEEGPGHYPGTPLPGQRGNAAIAGHRTTYSGPFYRLNDLHPGSLILVTTRQGSFRYRVFRIFSVLPTDTAVLAPSSFPELTLTTCNPLFSAAQRLVVQARLIGRAVPGDSLVRVVTTRLAGGPSTPPTQTQAPVGLSTPSLAANPGGTLLGALLWGAIAALVGLGAWLLGRSRHRPWVVYVAFSPVVAFTIFVFFGHLSPLLPPYL